jgi:hypothetical protein
MPTCLSSHQTDNPQDATAERTKLCLPFTSLSSRDTFLSRNNHARHLLPSMGLCIYIRQEHQENQQAGTTTSLHTDQHQHPTKSSGLWRADNRPTH